MPVFPDFMARLAQRRKIKRQVDGGFASYRMRLQGTASITVLAPELDPNAQARVSSEAWPVPATSGAYGDFMRLALNFNRNALHHLPCGILQDPVNPSLYRLIWRVSASDQTDEQWMDQLRMFGTLVDKAWSTMPVPGGSKDPRAPAGDTPQHVIFMP